MQGYPNRMQVPLKINYLGARLGSVYKQYDTNIMIGESTYELTKEYFNTRQLDYIRVKCKTLRVFVYELLGPINTLQSERAEQIQLYESVL